MIGRLEGVLREKTPTSVLVDVGGVGYQLLVSLSTFAELPDEGKVVSLRVHTHVREDALVLFGFRSAREREIFELLLLASRVGPKLALTVLSGIDAEDLVKAIGSGEVAVLQSVPGIGRRMAERIVVELRDRVADLAPRPADGGRSRGTRSGVGVGKGVADHRSEEILSALANLGVARPQAERASRQALEELGPEEPIESLIRTALRGLAR
ncbi:MAG: Holliday junction branch migration protein RuvA [Myxococcota bacterium]